MNHERHPDTVVPYEIMPALCNCFAPLRGLHGASISQGKPPYRAGEKHKKLIFKEKSYALQGAIFEVYKKMGSGFLESVYQECLEKEFDLRKIPFKIQLELTLSYKNIPLNQTYRADFICLDSILIEIKAVSEISDIHRAQLLNYLKATSLKLGLLVNFSSYLQIKKILKIDYPRGRAKEYFANFISIQ